MRVWVAVWAAMAVVGCTSDTEFRRAQLPDGDLIIARPVSRIVSERQRFDGTTVMCTEPSPDVAVALARSGNLTGSGSVPDGANVTINTTVNSSEQLTALKGRTAGVVALRDGLYFACQAYASGIIGQNSYALILSQYGRLLKELVGSDSGEEAVAAPAGKAGAAGRKGGGRVAPTAALDDVTASALLVSCINEFDPTRRDFLVAGAADGQPGRIQRIEHNKLLEDGCSDWIRSIAVGATRPPTPGRGRSASR